MGVAVETDRVVVLDPTVGPDAGGLTSAARIQGLSGKVAGLLDNGKPKADRFLQRVGQGLKERYGVKDVVLVRKADASAAAEPAILDDLAKRCHFVVAGVGD